MLYSEVAAAGSLDTIDAHNLDIVHECADLLFPSTVQFDFYLYAHGSSPDQIQDRARRVGASLAHQRYEYAAVELAYSDLSPEEVKTAYSDVNRTLARDPLVRDQGAGAVPLSSPMLQGIREGLRGAGDWQTPMLFPIDAWQKPSLQEQIKRWVRTAAQHAPGHSSMQRTTMAEREALILHQLHAAAVSLARDGARHRIAVIQGSQHGLTAKALEALGGTVTTTYLDEPLRSPTANFCVATRSRYGEAVDVRMARLCEKADRLGNIVCQAYLSYLDSRNERLSDAQVRDVNGRIGMLCLRGYTGELNQTAYTLFNELDACAANQDYGSLAARSLEFVAPLLQSRAA